MSELYTTLSEPFTHSAYLERRAWVRYSCDMEASCLPSGEDPEVLWPARVMNVSCGGVGLLLSRRFEPGTLVQVEVQTSKRSFYRPLLAQVVHVTDHARGGWLHGCTFTNPLGDEELRQVQNN